MFKSDERTYIWRSSSIDLPYHVVNRHHQRKMLCLGAGAARKIVTDYEQFLPNCLHGVECNNDSAAFVEAKAKGRMVSWCKYWQLSNERGGVPMEQRDAEWVPIEREVKSGDKSSADFFCANRCPTLSLISDFASLCSKTTREWWHVVVSDKVMIFLSLRYLYSH